MMNKECTLTVMCGLPGSGKSVIAKSIQLNSKNNCKIFSSDAYREKLLGNESDQSNNELVFKTLYSDLLNHLSNGYDAILDATNTTLKARQKVLNLVMNKFYDIKLVCYIVNTPFDECVRRDELRDRTVGKSVILKFLSSFQCPHYCEGWNEIIIHNTPTKMDLIETCAVKELVEIIDYANNFEQDNPHHAFTVGEHMHNMFEYFRDRNDDIRAAAGKFHDIGKLYTKMFDEYGIAHYYNHDSVGAYFLLCHLNYLLTTDVRELIEILFFVTWHMRAHNDLNSSEKAKNKYTALFGEQRYNKLIEFAYADQLCSGCLHRYDEIKAYITELKSTGGKYDGRKF